MHSYLSFSLWILAAALLKITAVAHATQLDGRSIPTPPTLSFNRREMTNAERLSRGLPLRPPTRRHSNIAARSQPSSTPQTTYSGIIELRNADNSFLGYISASDDNGQFTYDSLDTIGATPFSFSLPAGATSGTTVDITILNTGGQLLGLTQNPGGGTGIGVGISNSLSFNNVFTPGLNPGPSPATTLSGYSLASGDALSAESSIWSVNIITGLITPQWINSDASSPQTLPFVDQNGILQVTGDLGAYSLANNLKPPVAEISLNFIPN